MDKYESFISWLSPIAKPICDSYGIPTSVCIAQAALESGWGEKYSNNNIFNITIDGNINYMRSYASIQDAVEDYCKLITQSGIYNDATSSLPDVDNYIDNLSPIYEPLNSSYASQIKTTINANGLSAYDSKDYKHIATTGSTGKDSVKDVKGILKFAQFAETLAFRNQMMQGFEQSNEATLHQYLAKFMSKFYHNLYYVPTLPNNKVIVVKPETMFIDPPSCNIIYPTMKASLGFARNPKSEPTRLLMISDPVTNAFGVSGGQVTQLLTLSFLDEKEDGTQEVKSITNLGNKKYPMRNITTFEKKNGVRVLTTRQGGDLYLYLVSNQKSEARKVNGKDVNVTVISSASDPTGMSETLFKLADYNLLRARYEPRAGSAQMYFNPYVVPGFPMASVESGSTSSMNIFAYVTDVTHQITHNSWTTHVGFTGTHIGKEARPPVFPIIEDEYVEGIDTTYDNMLGAAVTRVKGVDGLNQCRTEYNATDGSVSSVLKKIWRPLTTRDEHLKSVCDGATVVQERGYKWLKNGDKSEFFDTKVQGIIKEYTQNIMDGNALYISDVR